MSGKTTIEWADNVWNPVTGCTKVSAGCKHCYAEGIANRFWGDRKFTDVQCHGDRLDIPTKWRKPRRVFVNSMSDLFHPDVPDGFIREVFWRMQASSRHTYQILTKRPGRMCEWMQKNAIDGAPILQNVWLGVSVENQETADERIPWLLNTPAAVRFVSYEPALGWLNLVQSIFTPSNPFLHYPDVPQIKGIDWVIAGGESGPGARPANPDWFRSVRDQCQAAGVPFFFKGWGNYIPSEQWYGKYTPSSCSVLSEGISRTYYKTYKRKAGRTLDGRIWNEFPEAYE